ncbi:hypothetical protein [Niallia taxi]|nr:hypothetical protein [Niallia taxi]
MTKRGRKKLKALLFRASMSPSSQE